MMEDDLILDESLSARRAWIEILAVWAIEHAYQRRSPQGERG